MRVYSLDPYVPGTSPVHTLNSRVKLTLTLAFILTVAALPWPAWPIYWILGTLDLAAIVLAELPARVIWQRSWPVLMVGFATIPLLWTTPGTAAWNMGLGNWNLVITIPGIGRMVGLLLKAELAVTSVVVLMASTPFPALLDAMETLKLPRLLTATIGLMWRYLFVLVEEVERLQRARDSRSGGKSGGQLIWRAQVTGSMVGNLFIRALERSDRIYNAMLARGYDGIPQTWASSSPSAFEKIVLYSGIGGLMLSGLVAWWGWG